MGVDSIKPKTAATVGKPIETKKAEPVKLEPAYKPPEAKKPNEGFDILKKKLMSVSGRYAAHKPMISERADLKESVSGQRSVMQANIGSAQPPPKSSKAGEVEEGGGPLKDAALDTASAKGANPGARPAASDFTAQAAATKGIAKGDIDGVANAKARAALEKDFGVKVKDGDKKWSTEDLSRAHESFAAMPPGDQAKLKGLDLIRNAKASEKSQTEMGDKGTVAGEYSPNFETKDGKRVNPGSISLYDAAFPAGTTAADRKESIHVITHEAGHAVEGRVRDDAMSNWSASNDKREKALAPLNAASIADGKAGADYSKALKPFASVSTKDKPKLEFQQAQNGVTSALNKMQKATTAAEIATAQTGLDAATKRRDAAVGGLKGKDLTDAGKMVTASDEKAKTTKAYAQANAVFTPADADTKSKLEDLKKVATVTVTTNADKTTTTSAKTSNEMASFSKARGTEKPVSGYGASKSPEGYAEAYALYQRDPAFMKTNFPKQYGFFHTNHKNAND